jgi:polyphosphate kinase
MLEHDVAAGSYQQPPRELSTYVDDHVAALMGDPE